MQILSRREVINRAREEKKKIALVFPIYYPSALLRSFNIQPIEIWNADNVELSLADAHIQSYTCSIGRVLLSFVTDKRFENDYDLIWIPHICDTFQQIGSLIVDFIKPRASVFNFYLPKRDDKIGIDFCKDELKRGIKFLEEVTSLPFNPERFKSELDKEIELNHLLKRVYLQREYLPISDYEFYQLIYARTYLPIDEFTLLLKNLLKNTNSNVRKVQRKIFVSGISIEPPEIFNIINSHNSVVVFDDLAISQRRLFGDIEISEDLLKMQSEIMLTTSPDPEKGSQIIKRAERLIQEAKRCGATGGLFFIMKFCEPEFFDYPQLRNYLSAEGIRTFLIEYEMSSKISKQNINRIQSFLEGLR
ncbi:MAG: 2-hydroxyacyl-CoA dehydratase subunit D [Myxococcota bacterium]